MIASKPPKPRKCKAKGCEQQFIPRNSMHVACCGSCAHSIVRAKNEQAEQRKRSDERKADRARKQELKPLKWFHARTKLAVHKYIRARDHDQPCISCGKTHAAQWDSGHYVSVGSDSSLRYDLNNIHKQCSVCNQHLSGNLIRYRQNLIHKIGEAEVLRLEGPQPVHKWTRHELDDIAADATRLTKELERTI